MQAVEVRIPGEYWDSFIYNDRLYLFSLNGDILVYRWDQLIQSFPIKDDWRPLFWQFLSRSRAWYAPELQKILESPKIRQGISLLIDSMTAVPHTVGETGLRSALVDVAASPAHPHTDVEAFYNTLYLSSSKGVHAASLSTKLNNRFSISTDIPAFRVACSLGSMAVAAGSEGMFEQVLAPRGQWQTRSEPAQLSSKPCVACSWASFDVIATSGPRSDGYVAAFAKPSRTRRDEAIVRDARELVGVVDAAELFPSSSGLLFGEQDLLILASPSTLLIDSWNPYLRRDNYGADVGSSLSGQRQLQVSSLTDDAIDGAATVFGITVEMDSSLIVIGVDGTIRDFGEPVNWRCFQRSKRYFNQLHVTHGDHIRVYAFVDDYFMPSELRGPAVRRPSTQPGD